VDYNTSKDIRNEVRHNIRQLYKDEQNNIAKECNSNHRKFGITLIVKLKVIIRLTIYLIRGVDHSVETVVNNDLDKANVLSNYFSSVFNIDSCEVVSLCDVKYSTIMDNIIIDVDDVEKHLDNLNVYTSYGPDMLCPRILKELQY